MHELSVSSVTMDDRDKTRAHRLDILNRVNPVTEFPTSGTVDKLGRTLRGEKEREARLLSVWWNKWWKEKYGWGKRWWKGPMEKDKRGKNKKKGGDAF